MAVAAGIALAAFFVGNQPVESWRVVALSSAESVRIDGGSPEVAAEFDAAVGSTAKGGKLDVQLGERVRVLVEPQSEVVFPRGPGRWVGGSRVLHVEEGEICATTEGNALGFELVVDTPEAEARVLGTTFAVARNELGTTVCLYEGSVEVRSKRGHPAVGVPTQGKVRVPRDGRVPEIMDLTDDELRMLETMFAAGLSR